MDTAEVDGRITANSRPRGVDSGLPPDEVGMTQSLRDTLERAAATGEVVRIVYHGGSQPGTVREVRPIAVSDVDLVAHCIASGTRKTFNMARIEIPASPDVRAYRPDPPTRDDRPLGTIVQEALPELRALGWHVEVREDAVSLQTISFFKNGKPRKPIDVVQLSCMEFVVDAFVELDGLQEETRISRRPYSVRSRRLGTRTFTNKGRALALFWEEARALAPSATPASP